jgi:hypothetical protein
VVARLLASVKTMKIKSQTFFAYAPQCEQAKQALSDGAYCLYMHVAPRAQRSSGILQVCERELADGTDKSLRSIGSYISEMEQKGVCLYRPASNQYERGELEICEQFWPYVKETRRKETREFDLYKNHIRQALGARPCIFCRFSGADVSFSEKLYVRGVSLVQIDRALVLGCAAKYISLLNSPVGNLISRFSYFSDAIEEAGRPLSQQQNWEIVTVMMTKYEICWCVTYLVSALKAFEVNSLMAERILKFRLEDVASLGNLRKMNLLSGGQDKRLLYVSKIFIAAEHSRGIISSIWFKTPISNHLFAGACPIDCLMSEDLGRLEAIYKHMRSHAGC